MDTMAYTYDFNQSYDAERQMYYDPSIYHLDASSFSQQELSGFETAEYSLAQMQEDMSMAMGCWEAKSMGYEMVPQFYGHETTGYDMGMEMEYAPLPDFYSCYQEEASAGSCQTSPFVDQGRLPYESSFHLPVSPITPAGSPLQYGAPPSALLLVPVENNGHYQYSAYQVPMSNAGDYLSQLAYQSQFEHPSPYSIPSLTASPLARDAMVEEVEEEDEEDEDEDDEEEDDRSLLPNCGNTELRGMGLYDDTPDLMYCATPIGCSPITPHGQLRATLGKGLVLERSFGLPEKMMMKDEESGEIIEGRLEIDEDESVY